VHLFRFDGAALPNCGTSDRQSLPKAQTRTACSKGDLMSQTQKESTAASRVHRRC
jgi:hypothetical protein